MGILTQNRRRPAGLGHLVRTAVDGLLAQDCLLCGQASGSEILCPSCRDDLPRLTAERCPGCALPTPGGETCGRCLSRPPHYDRTLAPFNYGFPADKLIQAFKYEHRLALAPYFGRHLAECARDVCADRIIPLPLHPKRLEARGFNQALELARPLAKALRLPIDTRSCQRIRHTPTQAALPWRDREGNIRGAFRCNGDLSGQRILLVDDVMTTGASLNECARTLKLHGASEVTLLVVARALP